MKLSQVMSISEIVQKYVSRSNFQISYCKNIIDLKCKTVSLFWLKRKLLQNRCIERFYNIEIDYKNSCLILTEV